MFKKILNRRIKVAIVGCGRISKNHFSAIETNKENFELVAICDTDKTKLDKISTIYNLPTYQLLDEMLKEMELDMVVLATPSGIHSSQAQLAASYGVNVMTEKPMATRWKDGLKMVKACDEANVRLFVVKQNRFNKTLQTLKKAIDSNRFGRVHLVTVNVFWTRPQAYYDQDSWRGTWEFDGGAFMNQASHYIDMVEWLFGSVEKVQALTTTTRNIEVEDTGVINLKWRNGALGSVSVTMLTFPKNYEASITIIGENGTVKVGGVAVNQIKHWDFKDSQPHDSEVYKSNYDTESVYGFGHSAYYKNTSDVIRGLVEPETDGREGLKSLELIIASYISSRDGKMVSLPLEY